MRKLLTGLALYEEIERNDFFDIPGLSEESLSFSLVTSALAYTGIAGYLGLEGRQDIQQASLDLDRTRRLTQWLFGHDERSGRTKLEDFRNLGKLSAIVGNTRAMDELDRTTIHEAVLFTEEPLTNFRGLMRDARGKLAAAQQVLNSVGSLDVVDLDVEDARKIAQHARDIAAVLQTRVSDDGEQGRQVG